MDQRCVLSVDELFCHPGRGEEQSTDSSLRLLTRSDDLGYRLVAVKKRPRPTRTALGDSSWASLQPRRDGREPGEGASNLFDVKICREAPTSSVAR